MKKIIYLLMIAFMAFSFYSCEEEEPPTPEVDAAIKLVEGQELAITVLQTEVTAPPIKFTSTRDWTASVNAEAAWCKISPKDGKGGDDINEIKFTIEVNDTHDDRVATIVIVSDEAEKTFTLTQKQKDALIISGQPTEPFTSEGGTFDLIVSENMGTPMVEISDEAKTWIKAEIIPASKALTVTKFKITIEGNTTTDERSSVITIKSGSGESEPFTVTQEALYIKVVSKPVMVGTLLVSDRNLGAPTDGVAYNYTNNEDHPDHVNSAFKGGHYPWTEAKAACTDGWRLPTKEELESISSAMQFSDGRAYLEDAEENRCYFPLSGFLTDPSQVRGHYWSGTSYSVSNYYAWSLHVGTINSEMYHYTNKSHGLSVRCVKGDDVEVPTGSAISVPVKLGTLLVSDRNVGTDVPQGGDAYNYTNNVDHPDHQYSAFKGGYYPWAEALTACPVDWRLPTKEELESISSAMQFSDGRAYLADEEGNKCYFPLSGDSYAPGEFGYYWSSTEYSDLSTWTLNVHASGGNVDYSIKVYDLSVRCVQGEPEPNPEISVPVKLGTLLISDRNLGTSVPQDGDAYNYSNDVNHADHLNSSFKGDYYTWEEALTACTGDWRLPTYEELESISSAMQFSDGRAYLADEEGNRCYFSMSGGSGRDPDVDGYYWPSTEKSDFNAWYLKVSTSSSRVEYGFKSTSFSVRCVKNVE